MHTLKSLWQYALLLTLSTSIMAQPGQAELTVWVSEAVVTTYTFNHNNFMERQKNIAQYFTADGWTAYSKALIASKLQDTVMKNEYEVSAVPTMPPDIKSLGQDRWQASMPILVVYQNPQSQQKQTLDVTIQFTKAASGQGVRGLAIMSLQSKVIKPVLKCVSEDNEKSN